VIHIWAATVLTIENHAARDVKYSVHHTIRATLSSRMMRWTGVVVLAFIIYHLAHFTLGYTQRDNFKENLPAYTMAHDYRVAGFPVVNQGESVLDVHTMMVRGFSNGVVSAFYIIAIGLLSFHLLHGFDSMFQSMGWRSARWSRALRLIAILFCVAYFLGNAAIPTAVLTGRVTEHAPGAVTQR
jgi:succinate dehydrogenase / fumarate reductase cytochrome b subunit